jgi:hypothetical protein
MDVLGERYVLTTSMEPGNMHFTRAAATMPPRSWAMMRMTPRMGLRAPARQRPRVTYSRNMLAPLVHFANLQERSWGGGDVQLG